MASIDLSDRYTPQPRQAMLHASKARQTLYGGAAGGGKSVALRWDAIQFCLENPGLTAGLFRRTYPELKANHIRFLRQEIPPEIGVWRESDKIFTFFNGSTIVCGFAENEADIEKYQGQEMGYIGIEEAGQFTAYQIAYLRGRNRAGGWKPAQPDYLPRLVLTANPGGQSHDWLKSTFIDPAPAETMFHDSSVADPDDPEDRGWSTMFIPASMKDNKYIDRGYAGQFAGLPDELAAALRDGNWDIVVGSFFGETFRRSRHVVAPFEIPKDWLTFRAYDHGSAAPFCCLWFAVVYDDDGFWTPDGRLLPRETLVVFREYYGAAGRNKGLKMPAEQIALGIKERDGGREPTYSVGDPSIWKFDGGPSIGERMAKIGVMLRRADNARIAGWDQVRRRLIGFDGEPGVVIFDSCVNLIRTLPLMQHDKNRIEDINTKLEDHAPDTLRYGVMSRPYTGAGPPEPVRGPWEPPTLAEWQAQSRRGEQKFGRHSARI